MNKFEGKVAIVTGSSRGIGHSIALHLANMGAKVVVNYAINREAAEELVKEILSFGGTAIATRADVSNAEDVSGLFTTAIEHYGKVDILVNNAGVIVYKPIKETTEEEFDHLFGVNVKGVFLALREAATRLSDGGRIINFSSSVTRLLLPTYGVYAATKAAVEQLTRVFAKEAGARGITVNSILPGPTNTELFSMGKTPETIERLAAAAALGRIGEPEDIARVVVFLAGDEAAWITGQNIGVNGGFA